MIFGVYDDTVVLLAAGISLKLINRKNLGELGWLERDILEIPHCGCAGNVKLCADFCGRYSFTERVDDLGNQTAGGTMIPGQKGVFLEEALAAVAAVTSLAQMQQSCSAKRNILDRLHSVVVHTVREHLAGRTAVLCPRQFEINMGFSGNILNIRDNYILQIQQLCGIIFVEHRDFLLFVIDDTIKDFVSMLNLFVWLRGQSMRLSPTFIVEPLFFPESNTEAYLTALWNEHLDNPALMCSILANGVYAGYCGVGNVTEHPPEISIELLPEWTNRGIGSTALRTMLDAFSERLQICYFRVRIDPANVASQRLFEKLGAKPNGLSEFLIHGKEWLRQMEEENLTKIDDQLITVARKFNVEPRQLLSHVLEYKLHWDFRSAQEP